MDKGLHQHALWTPSDSSGPRRRFSTSWDLGPRPGHSISCDVSAEQQHGETALGRVYMGGLPGRSVGFRSVDYKK